VIAFLDVEDEEGKRKDRDLAMLLEVQVLFNSKKSVSHRYTSKVAEKYKKSFHFLWVDAIKNLELAESLGTSILPSLSVYNPSKKVFLIFCFFDDIHPHHNKSRPTFHWLERLRRRRSQSFWTRSSTTESLLFLNHTPELFQRS